MQGSVDGLTLQLARDAHVIPLPSVKMREPFAEAIEGAVKTMDEDVWAGVLIRNGSLDNASCATEVHVQSLKSDSVLGRLDSYRVSGLDENLGHTKYLPYLAQHPPITLIMLPYL